MIFGWFFYFSMKCLFKHPSWLYVCVRVYTCLCMCIKVMYLCPCVCWYVCIYVCSDVQRIRYYCNERHLYAYACLRVHSYTCTYLLLSPPSPPTSCVVNTVFARHAPRTVYLRQLSPWANRCLPKNSVNFAFYLY